MHRLEAEPSSLHHLAGSEKKKVSGREKVILNDRTEHEMFMNSLCLSTSSATEGQDQMQHGATFDVVLCCGLIVSHLLSTKDETNSWQDVGMRQAVGDRQQVTDSE